jgi:multicomponent Na+:H+ antiporter subunit B
MTRPIRIVLFFFSAAGLAALLLWAVSGLHSFGEYPGPYGTVLNSVAVDQRHATNVVAAVVFDYRGFDTLGEELILFASVVGVALLLREVRPEQAARQAPDEVESEALRAAGIATAAAMFVLGLYVVAHGYLTPGGGFQGGVVVATAFLLVWLAGRYRSYQRLTPVWAVDFAEGTGAGGYVVIGLAALVVGTAFLHNLLGLGKTGTLASAGSIPMLNLAAALEVAAAFVLLFREFLDEHAVLIGRS